MDDKGQGGHAERFETLPELAPGVVPIQEDEDATAEMRGVAEHQSFEGERIGSWMQLHAGEDFEHLFGVGQAAAAGEHVGLFAHEHEIEKGVAFVHRAGEGGGEGDGILESIGLRAASSGIKEEGVADEVFLLEFLDHGFLSARPAGPMDASGWITGAVVADGDEFLRIADGTGEGHSAGMEAAVVAGEGKGREAEASGQDQDGGWEGLDGRQAAEETEGIGSGNFGTVEGETSAAERGKGQGAADRAEGRQGGDGKRHGHGAGLAPAEPGPTVETIAAVEPIPAGFIRFGEVGEFGEGRAIIRDALP